MNISSPSSRRSSSVRNSRACKVGSYALLALCGLMGAPQALGQAGDGSPEPAAASFQRPTRDYHDYQEICLLMDAWVAADPRVQSIDLGETREGRRVPALRFSSRPPEARANGSI